MNIRKITNFRPKLFIPIALLLPGILLFSGCSQKTPALSQSASEEISEESPTVEDGQAEKKRAEELEKELTGGNVNLSPKQLAHYGKITDCSFGEDKETLTLKLTLPDIPKSDDSRVYLFAFDTYENCEASGDFNREPITSASKSTDCELSWIYEEGQLFQQFVPALLLKGKYVPLSTSIYISNPEMMAENSNSYPEPQSKKGLLLDPQMLGTPLLTDLGVQYAIYNIPLSHILGESTDDSYPTISYKYKGEIYKFNGAAIVSYDNLFSYLTNSGIFSTAIILNDWNEAYPEMIHPLSRKKSANSYYYAFNTADEEGCRHLEAIASFLTKRYSGGRFGLVSDWVIANEINQHKIWNYMDTSDINLYAAEFEKALRIFYNAAKSNYADANVYFSIDHDWNNHAAPSKNNFNGKDLIEAINNTACEKGNYDWGLAIHPYPNPLTRVNYWDDSYDKTVDAPLLTLMNLSTVTDFLSQEKYLDRRGNVRSITVTELGFSSSSGEKLQAAAFAYCYYIIENNPYVKAFIMNRQTDSPEEIEQGLAFGIYELDQTSKFILDVFKNIDTEQSKDNLDYMLNILGADSLEEALSWAE